MHCWCFSLISVKFSEHFFHRTANTRVKTIGFVLVSLWLHSWTPPPLQRGGGQQIGRGGSDFSHKMRGVGKMGGGKKGGITYFDANRFQCYLSECLVCVCVCVLYLDNFHQYCLYFTGRTYSY